MPREDPDLVVLVGAARSGTTLLRLLLDAHPEIGAPAEAGIPLLIQTLGRVWWTVDADPTTRRPKDRTGADELPQAPNESDEMPELSSVAKEEIRRAAQSPMRHYCQYGAKRLYCDKSLDSFHYLEPVRHIFPETKYILLFRHVMDVVGSGLEASPWGFQAYGYLPFVQASPDNLVAALVNYWLAHVDKALRWQETHGELCHRVRYEDLVQRPESVLEGIFAFLGVAQDLSVLEHAFVRARTAGGPGDHKVMFTSSVHASSIGQGKRVPVAMIPAPLLEASNEKLKALGYQCLDPSWNTEPAPIDSGAASVDPVSAMSLAELLAGLQPRRSTTAEYTLNSFALVAEDDPRLRWVIDLAAGTVRQGDGEVECVIAGTADDLRLMLTGKMNPGVLLRSGRIRHLTAREDVWPAEVVDALRCVLDAFNVPGTPANDRSIVSARR